MSAGVYITAFDSSTGMARSLGRYLHGKDFPALGIPVVLGPLVLGLNGTLPSRARERLYQWAGRFEAIEPQVVSKIRAEEISWWAVRQYPKRRYPAVMIGSSNGAAIHLCAALGIPWLPQTFLVLVRHRGIHPDNLIATMEAGRAPGHALLAANPELQLHHMKDPNHDRLMSQEALYFRIKRLSLGSVYENFLTESLEPGGTIFLSECTLSWPTTQVSDRHYFQHGGLGGLDPSEYLHGSPRVARFLREQGSPFITWSPPAPDARTPEAEWGFEPRLGEDVERFARKHGYRVQKLAYSHPEGLSSLCADFYRRMYLKRGIESQRLVAECFFLLEPWWISRTGAIPFWMVFNSVNSLGSLERYIDRSDEPFDEIHIMLFSNGIESAGIASVEAWKRVLKRARTSGDFLGVDPKRYPRDFETFIRYHTELKKLPGPRFPLLHASIEELDEFLRDHRPKPRTAERSYP